MSCAGPRQFDEADQRGERRPLMTMTRRPTVGASAIRNACGTMMCRSCSKRDMPIDAAASHWVRGMASMEPRQISVDE